MCLSTVTCIEKSERLHYFVKGFHMLQGQSMTTCAIDDCIDVADGIGKVIIFGLIKVRLKYHIVS